VHCVSSLLAPRSYFELTAEVPEFMQGIALIASKTYVRSLIFILIYIESTFYIVIQSGEGDQPLLDVKVGRRWCWRWVCRREQGTEDVVIDRRYPP
jgi:hypothetical protein